MTNAKTQTRLGYLAIDRVFAQRLKEEKKPKFNPDRDYIQSAVTDYLNNGGVIHES